MSSSTTFKRNGFTFTLSTEDIDPKVFESLMELRQICTGERRTSVKGKPMGKGKLQPCKFGEKCKFKGTCKFSHPDEDSEHSGGASSAGVAQVVITTERAEDTAKRLKAFIKDTTTSTLSVVNFASFYKKDGGQKDKETISKLGGIQTLCEKFPELLKFINGSKPSLTFVKAL